jgi:hypothetical protein
MSYPTNLFSGDWSNHQLPFVMVSLFTTRVCDGWGDGFGYGGDSVGGLMANSSDHEADPDEASDEDSEDVITSDNPHGGDPFHATLLLIHDKETRQ